MTDEVMVRAFRAADIATLVRVFTDSVHVLGASRYTREQLAAWAPSPPDVAAWERRLARLDVRVAEVREAVAGFIAWSTPNRIELLFVDPDHSGRGVATRLYREAENALRGGGPVTELETEASLVARPFFERQGFEVVTHEIAQRNGVRLARVRMRKRLAGGASGKAPGR